MAGLRLVWAVGLYAANPIRRSVHRLKINLRAEASPMVRAAINFLQRCIRAISDIFTFFRAPLALNNTTRPTIFHYFEPRISPGCTARTEKGCRKYESTRVVRRENEKLNRRGRKGLLPEGVEFLNFQDIGSPRCQGQTEKAYRESILSLSLISASKRGRESSLEKE